MKVSALTQSSFSIVTDEEKGIVNTIRNVWGKVLVSIASNKRYFGNICKPA